MPHISLVSDKLCLALGHHICCDGRVAGRKMGGAGVMTSQSTQSTVEFVKRVASGGWRGQLGVAPGPFSRAMRYGPSGPGGKSSAPPWEILLCIRLAAVVGCITRPRKRGAERAHRCSVEVAAVVASLDSLR